MSELVLYTSSLCPFTQRVLMALHLHKLSFKTQTLAPVAKDRPEWFLKVVPSGETPVLKVGEEYVSDSMKIVEYIDTKLGSERVLFPQDSEEKVKETVKYIEEEWRPAFSKVMVASAPPMQKENRPKMMAAFTKFEEALKSDSPYYFGAKITAVDVAFAPFAPRLSFLNYFRGVTLPEAKFGKVLAYFDRLSSDPLFKPHAYKYYDVLAWYRERINRLPAQAAFMLQHQAFRHHLTILQEKLKHCAENPSEGSRQRRTFLKWKRYYDFFEAHSDFEDSVLFPAIENHDAPKNQGVSKKETDSHHKLEEMVQEINNAFAPIATKKANASEIAHAVKLLNAVAQPLLDHLASEEQFISPVAGQIPPSEMIDLAEKVYFRVGDAKQAKLIPWVLESLSAADQEQYMYSVSLALSKKPGHFLQLLKQLKPRLSTQIWSNLLIRLGDILPPSVASL